MHLLLLSVLLAAQGGEVRTLSDAMVQLQNDLSGAVARGHLALDDREKLNRINATLGRNIGRRQNADAVDEKQIKAVIKDVEALSAKGIFTDSDHEALNRDAAVLKHALKHPNPVYRGYRQGTYENLR